VTNIVVVRPAVCASEIVDAPLWIESGVASVTTTRMLASIACHQIHQAIILPLDREIER
jgi:hypothetical protein